MLFFARNNKLAFHTRGLWGALTLIILAVSYTTPWDSYLIQNEIWTYSPGNVLFTIYHIPIEEYFFFVIQTVIGCLLTSIFIVKLEGLSSEKMQLGIREIFIYLLSLGLLGLLYLNLPADPKLNYLKLVLFWSLPILLMQWCLGWQILLKFKRSLFTAVVSLCSYFWVADGVAISKEIWTFPNETISGIQLFGILPIEEALFFLVTNLMVVQGYMLFTQVDFKTSSFQFVKGS